MKPIGHTASRSAVRMKANPIEHTAARRKMIKREYEWLWEWE
jgi:hypothetical protein